MDMCAIGGWINTVRASRDLCVCSARDRFLTLTLKRRASIYDRWHYRIASDRCGCMQRSVGMETVWCCRESELRMIMKALLLYVRNNLWNLQMHASRFNARLATRVQPAAQPHWKTTILRVQLTYFNCMQQTCFPRARVSYVLMWCQFY